MSAVTAANSVEGNIERGFERVRDGFAEGQREDEGGAQLCIYRNGKKVVDLWTGRDTIRDRPYGSDTLCVIFSCTKGLVATVALRLVESGRLDPDARVAKYWPEFAEAGKSEMRVHHLMSHTAGLSGFDPVLGIGPRELLDFGRCAAALARMDPLWEPGTASMYHAITFGYLVGEVIRRIDGRTVGTIFDEDIARPLGLDLWIGLPAREEGRVAPQFSRRPGATVEQIKALLSGLGVDLKSRIAMTMLHSVDGTDEAMKILNSPEGHAAEIPAGNGVADARSLARMYAATIGEVDGIRLLSEETVARACVLRNGGLLPPGSLAKFPPFAAQPFGLGYMLTRPVNPMLGEGSFGHDGAGGRLGFAHSDSGFSVGYTANNMSWDAATGPDPRWMPWLNALGEIAER